MLLTSLECSSTIESHAYEYSQYGEQSSIFTSSRVSRSRGILRGHPRFRAHGQSRVIGYHFPRGIARVTSNVPRTRSTHSTLSYKTSSWPIKGRCLPDAQQHGRCYRAHFAAVWQRHWQRERTDVAVAATVSLPRGRMPVYKYAPVNQVKVPCRESSSIDFSRRESRFSTAVQV